MGKLVSCLWTFALAGCVHAEMTHTQFNGWDGLILHNRSAQILVVPEIGRVMQFSAGAWPGAFWAHPQLNRDLSADPNGWINFGGDKAWPAPQDDWGQQTGAAWPPPRTFDHAPYDAAVRDGRIELQSPVDPGYGVRVRRTIALAPREPVMTIDTVYEKVSGPPVKLAVWTITQLTAPERLFAQLPAVSSFPGGYRQRMPAPPRDLSVQGRLLGLARDPHDKTMIVTDADRLLWVGAHQTLEIARAGGDPAGGWPDGVHAQIYTSPAAAESYVELELLSPVRELAPGDSLRLSVRYTLRDRVDADPAREAARIFHAR